ncbi:MarR family winged helix-turn-helix transcriptional regulator [Oceanobacillus senegalensis]|uniref:MarR family winged helix-turn-helix transcriptional regulator n=1 Tax=Oceanobacillus senegalensis TaxID=1936063 RepID=UPI000A31226F|nr:MarR family transcriptional regulator [Oceanobacillus senegalensis]
MDKSKQYNENSESSLKLFIVLSRALESIEKKLAESIKGYGLNLTEFGVLELLFHKGDQPIQKIGKKILIASSSITYVVDKLEKKKYIKRVACPTDRRVTYAAITDEGRELMEEIFPKHQALMTEMMSVLDLEEKATMIEQLKKLGLSVKNYTIE